MLLVTVVIVIVVMKYLVLFILLLFKVSWIIYVKSQGSFANWPMESVTTPQVGKKPKPTSVLRAITVYCLEDK